MTTPKNVIVNNQDAEVRAARIAGIRAYADWLEAHPDVPAPGDFDAHHHDRDDRQTSIANVRAFIKQYGAERKTSGQSGWAILPVIKNEHVTVEHVWFVADDQNKRSWL